MKKQLEGHFRKAIGFLEEEGFRSAIIGGLPYRNGVSACYERRCHQSPRYKA